MDSITYITDNFKGRDVPEMAAIVGSFDCLHLGHEWCIEQLMRLHGNVLVLIPLAHPEKTLRKNRNACLWQRIEMLRTLERRYGQHVEIGLTREIFFIRLLFVLARNHGGAEIFFGMGSDTFGKVRATRDYYERCGYPWTAVEDLHLQAVLQRSTVFDRSLSRDDFLLPPPEIAPISSSSVRDAVRKGWEVRTPEADLRQELKGMVSPEIIEMILHWGIYRI